MFLRVRPSTNRGFFPRFSRPLQHTRRAFLHLRDGVAALLTPALCRVCSLPLLRAEAYPVCEACLSRLQPTTFAVCWKCGDAIGLDDEHAAGLVRSDRLRCGQCMTQEPRFHRASAFGSYRGTLRHLIHLHKFEAVQPLAVPLGLKLATAIADTVAGSTEPYTVVAVPLFAGKRSFNQSVLLADMALRELHRSHPELRLQAEHILLRRTRATESQSHLTPEQRKKNVRGAFDVNGNVRGRDILLIDDVYTTGATAGECTAVLMRAGAASVTVVTLARAHMRDTIPATGAFSTALEPRVSDTRPGEALPAQARKHTAEMGERKR